MPKSQMSGKAQVGLCLGVLLFFSVVCTITGFAASDQTRQKIQAFSADGITVTGTIANKYIHSVSKNWVYWLDVRFKSADGRYHRESTNVVNTIWDNLTIGGPVHVTYVKSRPEWFYVEDDAPNQRDIAVSDRMFRYGIIASLLLLIALMVFLTFNRGSGTPARGSSRSSTRAESPFGTQSPRRTGFGTRQRQ